MALKRVIHSTPEFILEAIATHGIGGTTVEFFSTWPKANHPEPHRLLCLTLPKESLEALTSFLESAKEA
jgi:hypothetical protein